MKFKIKESLEEPIKTWLLITDTKNAVTVNYRKRTKDFSINTTNPNWVVGDCRLRFMTEEDANRFAQFFIEQGGAEECKVSPSKTLREVVKIKRALVYGIPCPEDIPLYVSTNYLTYKGITKDSLNESLVSDRFFKDSSWIDEIRDRLQYLNQKDLETEYSEDPIVKLIIDNAHEYNSEDNDYEGIIRDFIDFTDEFMFYINDEDKESFNELINENPFMETFFEIYNREWPDWDTINENINEAKNPYFTPYGYRDAAKVLNRTAPQYYWHLKEIEMDRGDGIKLANYALKKGLPVMVDPNDDPDYPTFYLEDGSSVYHWDDYFYPYESFHYNKEDLIPYTKGMFNKNESLNEASTVRYTPKKYGAYWWGIIDHNLNNGLGLMIRAGENPNYAAPLDNNDNKLLLFKSKDQAQQKCDELNNNSLADTENIQYGVHQFSTESIIFRGTEEECIKYIDERPELWDDAEVYWMTPDDPHYQKNESLEEDMKYYPQDYDKIDLEYEKLDLEDRVVGWTYEVDKEDLYTFIFESCLTEEDFPAAFEDDFDPNNEENWKVFTSWLEDNFDKIFSKYQDKILDNWKEEAIEDAQENYNHEDYVDWDSMPGGHDDYRFDKAINEGEDMKFKLVEAAESKICCICKKPFDGYGNNAEPVCSGTCCDECNMKEVIPARLRDLKKAKMNESLSTDARAFLLNRRILLQRHKYMLFVQDMCSKLNDSDILEVLNSLEDAGIDIYYTEVLEYIKEQRPEIFTKLGLDKIVDSKSINEDYDGDEEDDIDESLNEGNSVSGKIPPALDSFLQDIAQMYGTIDYGDIMDHDYTEDDIRKLNNLRRRFITWSQYDEDDEEVKAKFNEIANKVAEILKRVNEDVNQIEGNLDILNTEKNDNKMNEDMISDYMLVGFNHFSPEDLIVIHGSKEDLETINDDMIDYSEIIPMTDKLIWIENNDEYLQVSNTNFNSIDEFRNAVVDEMQKNIDAGNHEFEILDLTSFYIDEDSEGLSAQELTDKFMDWIDESFVDNDSSSAIQLVKGNELDDQFISYTSVKEFLESLEDREDWNDDTDFDIEESAEYNFMEALYKGSDFDDHNDEEIIEDDDSEDDERWDNDIIADAYDDEI